jgi:predicted  nucleic acid-binding Zn-ribbon protein
MTNAASIKDQIRKLVDMQAVDIEAYRLKTELKEKPLEIESLRVAFEAKKANLKKIEEQLKALMLKQKEYEGDLKTKEDAITKADGQLSQLKTNKEYSAKLLEIENIKADKSLSEEKILIGFDQMDEARKAMEAEKVIVAKEEKEFLAKKKEIDDLLAVANDQLAVKESQRNRLAPDVRPDILSRYERLVQNKEGLGIVPVKNGNCQGCFMHLTEQALNKIKINEELMSCDTCARILYFEEEL